MKKYINKKVLIISICIVLIGILSYMIYTSFSIVNFNHKSIDLINYKLKVKTVDALYDKNVYYENKLPSYRKQYNNNDIVAELKISSVGLDTLVTRSADNEFYLNKNLYKQPDKLGVPFADYRNTNLNKAKQINIYGHNTDYSGYYEKLPFYKLNKFLDNEFVKNNPYVILEIDSRRFKYKIISTKISTDQNGDHMNLEYEDDNNFLTHVKKLRNNARYDSGDKVTKDDDLLIFQSCQYNPPNSFLIITCLKVYN